MFFTKIEPSIPFARLLAKGIERQQYRKDVGLLNM